MTRVFSVCSIAAMLAVLGGGASAQAMAEMKIATMDMQKALGTIDAGKKARTELETNFNKKKKELQGEEQSIRKMHEELQKQSLVMNEQALSKKQAELQQRVMKLQESTMKSQTELQKQEQDLTKPLVEKFRKVIAEIAKKKGYNVVLERNENTVLFSLDQDDLTEEAIKEFNKI